MVRGLSEVQWLYLCHALRCVGDRAWQSTVPLFLAAACPSSLAPMALVSLSTSLFSVCLSTWLAARVVQPVAGAAQVNFRRFVFWLFVENAAVVGGGAALLSFGTAAAARPKLCAAGGATGWSPLSLLRLLSGSSGAFVLGCVLLGTDAVVSGVLSIVVERDWLADACRAELEAGRGHGKGAAGVLPPLQRGALQNRLADANARMARIDLLIALLVPLVLAQVVQGGAAAAAATGAAPLQRVRRYAGVVWILAAWHVFATLWLALGFWRVGQLRRARLPLPPPPQQQQQQQQQVTGGGTAGGGLGAFLRLPLRGRLLVLAYAALYWTVLSPGPLLTAWLKSASGGAAADGLISVFRAALQACGALATVLAPVAASWGSSAGPNHLWRAALAVQAAQTLAVVVACWFFFSSSTTTVVAATTADGDGDGGSGMRGFLVAVVLSRLGLWAFDLLERQLVQETAGEVAGGDGSLLLLLCFERSLCNVGNFAVPLICLAFRRPEQFGVLVLGSALATVLATTLLAVANFLPLQQRAQLANKNKED
jgi:hypothetical protein